MRALVFRFFGGRGARRRPPPPLAFRKANKYGYEPRYGAFAFFHFPGATSGIDHVGWVESWTAGTLSSLDGNTASSGGQYNGGAVLRRSRDRSLVVVYGYPDYAASAPPPLGVVVSNAPPVAILTHPAWPAEAYAEVCADGGVFDFGGAPYYGSEGSTHLNAPIVDATVTRSGQGYWLVAADGGVFTHGDAEFHGSTGAIHLNKPIIRMAPTPSGHGYLLTAADGGVFAFGDAVYHGRIQYPAT